MSIKKTKSGTYKAIVQLSVRNNRRQVKQTFERKLDAERWHNEQKILALRPGSFAPQASLPTIEDFSKTWLTDQHRAEDSTRARYQTILKVQVLPAFGKMRLDQISVLEVERWLKELRVGGLSPASANLALFVLRRILSEAVYRRFIQSNPVAGVRRIPKVQAEMSFWTAEEASKFLRHCKAECPKYFPIFFMALNTGMRLNEMVGLKWDCVNVEGGLLTIKRTICCETGRLKETTKGKQIRYVPVNPGLRSLLVELKAGADGSEYVLSRDDYRHVSRDIKVIARKAGVREIRFHDTRHTFAALWVMSGQSIYELQKVLGHSSVTMTEKYSHLSPGHLKGATDFLKLGADC